MKLGSIIQKRGWYIPEDCSVQAVGTLQQSQPGTGLCSPFFAAILYRHTLDGIQINSDNNFFLISPGEGK